MAAVVFHKGPDGIVDVISAPSEATFSTAIIAGRVPLFLDSISVHDDLVICGSLLGAGAVYRITERDDDQVTAQLVSTSPAWGG